MNHSVSWTEGVLNLEGNETLEGTSVWVLKIGSRTVLHAVQQSPISEAVSATDRKLIGQAVADALSYKELAQLSQEDELKNERQKFEAWADEEGLDLSYHDGYIDACTSHAWNGWEARRKADKQTT